MSYKWGNRTRAQLCFVLARGCPIILYYLACLSSALPSATSWTTSTWDYPAKHNILTHHKRLSLSPSPQKKSFISYHNVTSQKHSTYMTRLDSAWSDTNDTQPQLIPPLTLRSACVRCSAERMDATSVPLGTNPMSSRERCGSAMSVMCGSSTRTSCCLSSSDSQTRVAFHSIAYIHGEWREVGRYVRATH